MTENEAIKVLKNNYPKTCRMVNGRYQGGFDNTECDFGQALTIAITALKEIQQYRDIGTVDECRKLASIVNKAERDELAKIIDEWLKYSKIGTVEECRAAVEKQKLKNPVKDKYHHNCCPNCGWIVSGEGGYGEEFCPHCENCGQAIQWDKNLEGMEDE